MQFAEKTKIAEFTNNQGTLTFGLLQGSYALINIIISLLLSIVGSKFFG
jgi:hypothetical protein